MEEKEAGSGGERERGRGDGRKKGVCRGVMVRFRGSESKMDAVANVQTAFRQR